MTFIKDLNAPLLKLSRKDNFTLEDACKGVHIFGGIGSGKTSGSGQALAGAYLRAGMGGLVLPAKPGDIDMWFGYAKKHGREKSIKLLDEGQGFNFLDYELGRHGTNGIGSVTESTLQVMDLARERSSGQSSRGGDPFWDNSTSETMRYTIPPIFAALGSVTIPNIIRFISSAPSNLNEITFSQWQERSFMYQVMDAAENSPKVPLPRGVMQNIINFWAERFPAIPDKTRGNIVASVTTVLDRFMHGTLQRVFCERTTIVPERMFHGTIFLVSTPTLTGGTDAATIQKILKLFTQRAILNRNSLAPEHRERPVFIWGDESQQIVTPEDGLFQSVCRDSRACTVYLTQSLPNYYSKMGGNSPRDDAHTLVGKFGNLLFHSNSCPDTNEYAARVVGKAVKRRKSYNKGTSANLNVGMSAGDSQGDNNSHNYSQGSGASPGSSSSGSGSSNGSNWGTNHGQSKGTSESEGYSEATEYIIEPGDFARIFKTGGPQNDHEVTGLWYKTGAGYKASGNNILMGVFKQR
jgi:hypothetical protein